MRKREKECKGKLFGYPVDVSSGFVPTGNPSLEAGIEGKKQENVFALRGNGIKRTMWKDFDEGCHRYGRIG